MYSKVKTNKRLSKSKVAKKKKKQKLSFDESIIIVVRVCLIIDGSHIKWGFTQMFRKKVLFAYINFSKNDFSNCGINFWFQGKLLSQIMFENVKFAVVCFQGLGCHSETIYEKEKDHIFTSLKTGGMKTDRKGGKCS